jgi:dTDP-4-amino-4,6-dideoxygalactose transaminase
MKSISPKLRDDVVPWAFPVLFEDRVRHEQILRRLGVPLFTFGEVLHSELSKTRDHARDEAEALSKRLLLLPVHANLTEADVASYAKILMDYVNGIQRGKIALHDDELMSSAQSSRGKSRA